MAGIILVVMVMVAGLPESIERQKEQQESQEERTNERDTADDRTTDQQNLTGTKHKDGQ